MARLDELLDMLDATVSADMMQLALTHRSYAYENGNLPTNERLEFLGDAVLGVVVTDTLFRTYPESPEGQLARMRSSIVNSRALAEVARTIGLGEHIRLGKGEVRSGGADKASILADTLEAVIGAVYVDAGLARAAAVVHHLFDPLIERAGSLGAGLDWKTSLQDLCAQLRIGVPEYHVVESGPDHDKRFEAVVRAGDIEYPLGSGHSKKEAEHEAAANAWKTLKAAHPDAPGPSAS